MRLRNILLAGAAAGAAFVFTGMAEAQDSGVETVVVTGTRIPRPELDTPNPIVTLGSQEIEHSGTINLTEYLKRIPALAGSLGDIQTSGYNTPAAADASSLGGLNLLDLRNLGYVRTLVLIDGHRTVGSSTGSTAVDTDSIPISLIDRVDVVTGGASAVYGADAVSGVVNFVMKHDLEGIHARVQAGTSQDGGGAKELASVSMGHNFDDDKGNVTFAFEGTHQDALFFTKRSFTKDGGFTSFVSNPANLDGTNPKLPANIPTNNAQFIYSAPTGAIETDPGLFNFVPDHLGNGQPFNLGTDIGGGSAIGSSGMPYANDLQGGFQPTENRGVAQVSADYKVSPMFKLSGEFKYAYVNTRSLSSPTFDDDIPIRAQNAFLPANISALINANGTGQGILSEDYLQLRNSEQVKRNTYRAVLGATGDLGSPGFLQDLKYNASYVYGQTDIDDIELNNRNIDRFAAALDSTIDPATGKPICRSNLNPNAKPLDLNFFFGAPSHYFSDTSSDFSSKDFGTTFTPGPNSGCVAFNPFDPKADNRASIAFFTQDTHTKGFLSQQVFNGYFSANIPQFKSWGFADALSVVLGGEWRKEISKASSEPDSLTPGLFWIGGSNPVDGSYTVGEGFAEATLPVVEDQPFAKELTVHGAVRRSHYDTAGDSTSWEMDGIWSPIEGIKFRGTDAVAVRAPNIGELFAPTQNLFDFVTDPCDKANINTGTAFRKANCVLIENAVLGPGKYKPGITSVQSDQDIPYNTTGNPNLVSETARTVTLGMVLQPAFLDGFTATVDWYRVRIANAIEAPSAQNVADECVDLSTIVNPYCAEVHRTAKGQFPGSVNLVSTTQVNVAQFETSGVDLTVNYHVDTQDWFGEPLGAVDFHLIGNHLDSISTVPLPGQAAIKSENEVFGGVDGGPTPYWSANFDAVWSLDKWSVDYNVDWYDGVLIASRQAFASQPNFVAGKYKHVAARDVHSLQVGYDFMKAINVYAGVDNLWYQKPTIGQNAYPVDPIGRFFYLGVKVDMDYGDF